MNILKISIAFAAILIAAFLYIFSYEKQGYWIEREIKKRPQIEYSNISFTSKPFLTLFCHSNMCKRLSGLNQAKGITISMASISLIILDYSSFKPYILIHEQFHCYFDHKENFDAIPHWLQEGIALHISDDPRFKNQNEILLSKDAVYFLEKNQKIWDQISQEDIKMSYGLAYQVVKSCLNNHISIENLLSSKNREESIKKISRCTK